MATGDAEFKPYGAISLRIVAPVGGHVLIAHSSLPKRHAWLVAAALSDSVKGFTVPDGTLVPWHPGAQAFRNGEAEPAAAAQ